MGFQSTHSLRSATGNSVPVQRQILRFNPRTPCGVRLRKHASALGMTKVSIHALLAECDLEDVAKSAVSTSFNPRTPCGVRPTNDNAGYILYHVSIHALLAECDQPDDGALRQANKFQSTHSLRSATPGR